MINAREAFKQSQAAHEKEVAADVDKAMADLEVLMGYKLIDGMFWCRFDTRDHANPDEVRKHMQSRMNALGYDVSVDGTALFIQWKDPK